MKVIITGSTGMVGKGVLLECLKNDDVTEVLLINRSPIDISSTKIKEVIHKDFLDFAPIQNELKGYDACFHCMGVSSVGISKENYYKLTYSVTKNLAETVHEVNPDITFTYVSGQGTDSSEKGRSNWARVKGKTENYLFTKGFKDFYAFRPGGIVPGKGIKTKTGWINVMLVLMKPLFALIKNSDSVTTSEKIGNAMINAVKITSEEKILHNKEINALAKK